MELPRLVQTGRMYRCIPHEADSSGLLVSRGLTLGIIADPENPQFRELGRIPGPAGSALRRVRLLDRALKLSILQALRVPGVGVLASTRTDWWLLFEDGNVTRVEVPAVGRPMARGLCALPDGSVLIGEYRGNPERMAVSVWRSRDMKTFEQVWEFPAGSVRHVHALIPDPQRAERVWVLTGDHDSESRISRTDDGFESLVPVVSCGQTSRATDLLIEGDRLTWGMDSPLESSAVVSWKPGDEAPERVFELPGPAYYLGANEAGGRYMGTTVEPGPSVLDDMARLYARCDNGSWEEVLSRRNDRWPQYGILYLPRGFMPGASVACAIRGLTPGDGDLLFMKDRML